MRPVLIAVDWGTTNFRAWLMGRDGQLLEAVTRPTGIRQVSGPFSAALAEAVGPWRSAHPALPVLMSGMIGSRQGWVEAPYVFCPASAAAIAAGLVATPDDASVRIVPGVAFRPTDAAPDVMRGEETQLLGLDDGGDGLVVMPGTHSKWVERRGGVITHFATYMTGELFAVLRQHSILGAMMQDGASGPGFQAGLRAGLAHGGHGFIRSLFGVRAKGLFGDLPADQAADYLSGLLIAGELNEALAGDVAAQATREGVTLVGAGALATLYRQALAARGIAVRAAPEDVAARGLWRIAQAKGMVTSDG